MFDLESVLCKSMSMNHVWYWLSAHTQSYEFAKQYYSMTINVRSICCRWPETGGDHWLHAAFREIPIQSNPNTKQSSFHTENVKYTYGARCVAHGWAIAHSTEMRYSLIYRRDATEQKLERSKEEEKIENKWQQMRSNRSKWTRRNREMETQRLRWLNGNTESF